MEDTSREKPPINAERVRLNADSLKKVMPAVRFGPSTGFVLPSVETLLPALNLFASNVENLTLSLFPALQSIHDARERILENVTSALSSFDAAVKSLRRAHLPPNLRDIALPRRGELLPLLVEEGLPIAWVPPAPIVQRLLDAPDAQARRRIIGRAWQPISKACRAELGTVASKRGRARATFALQAADALEDGHHAAAQALASNLLDTLVREAYPGSFRQPAVVNHSKEHSFDDESIRMFLVFAGIRGSYKPFWPGDPIPRSFSRHATTHAVGTRQFSRLNALIALMHATALIKLLESQPV